MSYIAYYAVNVIIAVYNSWEINGWEFYCYFNWGYIIFDDSIYELPVCSVMSLILCNNSFYNLCYCRFIHATRVS